MQMSSALGWRNWLRLTVYTACRSATYSSASLSCLPACPPGFLPLNHLLLQPGRVWELVVDTARAAPYDAYLEGGDVIGWVPRRAGPMLCAMLCAFL
jgi:hypothetical protein